MNDKEFHKMAAQARADRQWRDLKALFENPNFYVSRVAELYKERIGSFPYSDKTIQSLEAFHCHSFKRMEEEMKDEIYKRTLALLKFTYVDPPWKKPALPTREKDMGFVEIITPLPVPSVVQEPTVVHIPIVQHYYKKFVEWLKAKKK